MRRSVVVFLTMVLLLFTTHEVTFAVVGVNLDIRLKFLLNDETLPFLPDTIRYDFLEMGIQKCAMLSDGVAQFRRKVGLNANADEVTAWFVYNGYPKNILAVWLKESGDSQNSKYAVSHIRQKDIGLKQIATDEPLRYWYQKENYYVGTPGVANPGFKICVYPPNDASADSLIVFGSYIPFLGDSMSFHPAFENELVLYALYLCYKRMGRHQIAEFLRQVATNEILDLKLILDNRPMDVRIGKEVIAR